MSNIGVMIGTIGNANYVQMPAGTTVAKAFDLIGFTIPPKYEVMVDGVKVTDLAGTVVYDGQTVLASDTPKGNE